jgi:hypothetical protein
MSRWVEYSEHGATPLVKVYTKKQARELFRDFREVKIDIEQLHRSEVRLVGPLIPEAFMRAMRRSVGWNLIVTAIK